MKAATNQELPIYCIGNFENEEQNKAFSIHRLEDLVTDYEFTAKPHRHQFYTLTIFTGGSGKHTIDFKTYDVKPCSIFFLCPGQMHHWTLSDDVKGYAIFWYESFLPMRSNSELNVLPFFQPLDQIPALYIDCFREAEVGNVVNKLFKEYSLQQPYRERFLKLYLELLLLELSRFPDNQTKNVAGEPLNTLYRYMALIDQHYDRHLSVQEYADQLNMSPKNLNKICKRAIDKTASELIYDRLILEAQRLLTYTNQSVQQIGFQLGFLDPSYFVRFFKKQRNCTPEQFRKNNPV
jgi:AraC family transcriptional regulator, transcriptional activator of pobA